MIDERIVNLEIIVEIMIQVCFSESNIGLLQDIAFDRSGLNEDEKLGVFIKSMNRLIFNDMVTFYIICNTGEFEQVVVGKQDSWINMDFWNTYVGLSDKGTELVKYIMSQLPCPPGGP